MMTSFFIRLTLLLLLMGSIGTLASAQFHLGIKGAATMNRLRSTGAGTATSDDYFGLGILNAFTVGGEGALENGQPIQALTSETDFSRTSDWQFRFAFGFVSKFELPFLAGLSIAPELLFNIKSGRDDFTLEFDRTLGTDWEPPVRSDGRVLPEYFNVNGPDFTISNTSALVGQTEDVRTRYDFAQIQLPVLIRKEFLSVAKPYLVTGPTFGITIVNAISYDRVEVNSDNSAYDMSTEANTLDELTGYNVDASGNRTENGERYENAFEVGWAFGAGVNLPLGLDIELRYDIGITPLVNYTGPTGSGVEGEWRSRQLSFSVAKYFF